MHRLLSDKWQCCILRTACVRHWPGRPPKFNTRNIYIHSPTRYTMWSQWISFNPLKLTDHVMHQQFNIQQLYVLPNTVFMCFVFIWEQTATCATYSINWLVLITEMKSVYCAVRTVSLNKAVCASSFLFIRGTWREGTAGRLTTGCWGVWLRVWPPLALLQNLLRIWDSVARGPSFVTVALSQISSDIRFVDRTLALFARPILPIIDLLKKLKFL